MDFGIPIIDSVEDGEYKYYFIVVDQKHEEEDLIIRVSTILIIDLSLQTMAPHLYLDSA